MVGRERLPRSGVARIRIHRGGGVGCQQLTPGGSLHSSHFQVARLEFRPELSSLS